MFSGSRWAFLLLPLHRLSGNRLEPLQSSCVLHGQLPCASYVGELVAFVLCQLLDLLHIVAGQTVNCLFQVSGAIF